MRSQQPEQVMTALVPHQKLAIFSEQLAECFAALSTKNLSIAGVSLQKQDPV